MSERANRDLLEQFQRLDEKLLTSEFTFGFELEAVDSYYDSYSDEDEDEEGGSSSNLESIRRDIDNQLTMGAGARAKEIIGHSGIHQDTSVNSDAENGEDEGLPFEYSSAIFPCTPFWFNQVIKALRRMFNRNNQNGTNGTFYTNDSCGFHHHLHFNGMTERDMVWIYCNMAMDENFYNTFSTLQGTDDNYNLFDNNYAMRKQQREMKSAIEDEDWVEVLHYLNTDKWRAFRIHPQGTLEWRGPRNFMNTHAIDNINKFYMLFNKLIGFIKNYMDRNTLVGKESITKKDLFNELKEAVKKSSSKPDMEFLKHSESYDSRTPLKFKSNVRKLTEKTANKLTEAFKKAPLRFVTLAIKDDGKLDKYFELMLENERWRLEDLLKGYIFKEGNKISEEQKKAVASVVAKYIEKYINPRNISQVMRDFGLLEYKPDLLTKSLRNCLYITDFDEILTKILTKIPQSLKTKDIEKGLYSLLKHGEAINKIASLLIMRKYRNFFGDDYIARIMNWALGAAAKTGLTYMSCSDTARFKKFKDMLKATGWDTEWDNNITKILHLSSNTDMFYAYVNRPNQEKIAKLIGINSNLFQKLTPDEQGEIDYV